VKSEITDCCIASTKCRRSVVTGRPRLMTKWRQSKVVRPDRPMPRHGDFSRSRARAAREAGDGAARRDVQYGLSRARTGNLNGNKEGFTDYASFAVPANLVPYIFQAGAAPAVTPNGHGGGNGGGSHWSGLSAGTFGTACERQANHSVSGSLTKTRGKGVHKAGLEFRNLVSNDDDPEQASVGMPSPFAHTAFRRAHGRASNRGSI
jgi:hypothetical protein